MNSLTIFAYAFSVVLAAFTAFTLWREGQAEKITKFKADEIEPDRLNGSLLPPTLEHVEVEQETVNGEYCETKPESDTADSRGGLHGAPVVLVGVSSIGIAVLTGNGNVRSTSLTANLIDNYGLTHTAALHVQSVIQSPFFIIGVLAAICGVVAMVVTHFSKEKNENTEPQ
jgi:hypothetical protein